jgi:hypothetical integral membrane protein (TIGR02206 family)
MFLLGQENGFQSYSPLHFAAAAFFFALMAGAIGLGLLLRRGEAGDEYRWRQVLATTIVVYFFWYMAFEARPYAFDIQRSLPLHFCDFAWVPCAIALLRRNRTARVLAYYWGVLLSGQAFIQPTLNYAPSSLYFWTFFTGHTLIVGAGLYVLIVNRYRPTLRDFVKAVVWTFGVVVALFFFNMIFDTNYGYVGRARPTQRTLIDALGDWPLRVLWMMLIGVAVFFLAYVPWPMAARLRPKHGD